MLVTIYHLADHDPALDGLYRCTGCGVLKPGDELSIDGRCTPCVDRAGK